MLAITSISPAYILRDELHLSNVLSFSKGMYGKPERDIEESLVLATLQEIIGILFSGDKGTIDFKQGLLLLKQGLVAKVLYSFAKKLTAKNL